MKHIILSIIAILSVATLSSCKVEKVNTDFGPTVTKNIAAKDFDELAVAYPADITYIPSDSFSVSVKAPQGAFGEKFVVRVVKGELQIISKREAEDSKGITINIHGEESGVTVHNTNASQPKISVTVRAPYLKEVEIAGDGTFVCDTTMTVPGKLEFELAGSGEFNVKKIRAKSLSGEIAGAGSINANLERVAYTDMEIAGAGKLNLGFKQCGNVKIEIAGVGKATLKGDIENLERDIAGVGKINTDGLTVRGKVTDEEDDDDF